VIHEPCISNQEETKSTKGPGRVLDENPDNQRMTIKAERHQEPRPDYKPVFPSHLTHTYKEGDNTGPMSLLCNTGQVEWSA
jgi:hypothetical protein